MSTLNSPCTADPLGDPPTKYWSTGFGTWIVYIGTLSSMVAFTQTAFNAGTRVLFALGRLRLLPSALGRTHHTYRTPHVATLALAIASVTLGFPLAFRSGSLNVWVYYGFMISCMFLLIYAVTNVALIVDTYRNHTQSVHWLTLVLSLGLVAMLYPLYRVVFPLTDWPYPLLIGLVVAWIVLGALVMVWLSRTKPDEARRAGLVMTIGAEDETSDPVRQASSEPRFGAVGR